MLAADRATLLRPSRPAGLILFRPAVTNRRQICAKLQARKDKESPSIQEFLATVLKDELKIEKERYRQSDDLMDGPPKPWKVEDRPFTNMITLARTFKNEDMLVSMLFNVSFDYAQSYGAHETASHGLPGILHLLAVRPHA